MLKDLGSPEPGPGQHPTLEHPPGTQVATSVAPWLSLPQKKNPPAEHGSSLLPQQAKQPLLQEQCSAAFWHPEHTRVIPATHGKSSPQTQPPCGAERRSQGWSSGAQRIPRDVGAGSGMRLGFSPRERGFLLPQGARSGRHGALRGGNCPSTQPVRPFLVLDNPLGVSSTSNSSLGKGSALPLLPPIKLKRHHLAEPSLDD